VRDRFVENQYRYYYVSRIVITTCLAKADLILPIKQTIFRWQPISERLSQQLDARNSGKPTTTPRFHSGMRRFFAVAGAAGISGLLLFSYATDARSPQNESDLVSHRYYENRDHHWVHSPSRTYSGQRPPEASAQCADGTYSFSEHTSGTCSHHGGVLR
jgi:hypothetical protein